MKIHKRMLATLASALAFVARCPAQETVPAPQSLPPCLIQYNYAYPLGNAYGSSVVIYNADQSYVEINSSLSYIGTLAASSGTYSYSVDPENPAHATISYQPPRSNQTATDQLYFYATNSGDSSPTGMVAVGVAHTAFALYPRQVGNGAINVSNRCQLASGGSAISGFVIESGGPRWVLIRAVGASLKNFGVSPVVSSPSFTLYDPLPVIGLWYAEGSIPSAVWSSDPNLVKGYNTIFSLVGAFPLNAGSDEGVLLVPLNPGAYTAVFQAGSAGTILCEVYLLPY